MPVWLKIDLSLDLIYYISEITIVHSFVIFCYFYFGLLAADMNEAHWPLTSVACGLFVEKVDDQVTRTKKQSYFL